MATAIEQLFRGQTVLRSLNEDGFSDSDRFLSYLSYRQTQHQGLIYIYINILIYEYTMNEER